jgi:Flp pilus assembly protein TadG
MVTRRRPAGRQAVRRGSALILTAIALIPLLAMVAFAVDWGRICVTKAELQRAADAAAMAGAWELLEAKSPTSGLTPIAAEAEARNAAVEYSALNNALGKTLQLQNADIAVGRLANPLVGSGDLDTSQPEQFNTVRVVVRRDAGSNGSVSMFFARVIGKDTADVKASATAAIIADVAGFKKPLAEESPNLPLLPFAVDTATWQVAVGGEGPDEWKWDADTKKFVPGSDGVPEFNLYPQDTGSTANRGTVNIGTSANSTSNVARQITEGISSKDLDFHGGELTLDSNGKLFLSGDPGISAGFKGALAEIRGEPRVVPIFSDVQGDGAGSIYTVTGWAGIRIADVDLGSENKFVIVQPARVITGSTLPGSGSTSNFVFSRVWLAH